MRPVTKRSSAALNVPIISARHDEQIGGALQARSSGDGDAHWAFTSPLTYHDGIYILDLALGTPPQMYSLQLDLASADLVVASSSCTTDAAASCPHAPDRSALYDAGRSASFAAVNGNETTFNLTFADGSYASGFLATETLTLPIVSSDGNASTIRLHGQAIGIVNATSINLAEEGIVGIVGLGFPRLSQLVRAGLDAAGIISGDDPSTTSGASGSATSTSASGSSWSAASSSASAPAASSTLSASSAEAPFSTITTALTTSPTSRAVVLDSSNPSSSYYPPLLQNLFSAASTAAGDPLLAYPVIGLALANSSSPFSRANDNASITVGGVSEQFVTEATLGEIEWTEVVPFAEAVLYATAGDGTMETSSSTAASLSDITTLEQEPYLYWAVEMHSIAVNGTPVSLSPTYNSSWTGSPPNTSIALLDVGSNGIWAPAADVEAIFSQIKDARLVTENQYAVPCDSEVTISFRFGPNTTPIVLQPSDWIIGVLSGSPSLCAAWPMIAEPSADGIDWQLGTPFLRKTYSIYSYGFNGDQAPMVGFLPLPDANARNSNATATSASASASATVVTSVLHASEISSLVTATINTNPPNVLLPTPTFSTPPYAFDTNSIPTLGVAQATGLANSSFYSVAPLPIVPTAANSSLAASASAARSMGSNGNSNASNGSSSGAMALLDFPPVSHLVLALIIAVVVGFFFS